MGIFQKLFCRKPKSLGEGLARVKKMFNAIGEDIAQKPGHRLYKTPSGNRVEIRSCGSLSIKKHLAPLGKSAYKNYVGKLSSVDRHYINFVKPGDNMVVLDRSQTTSKFVPLNSKKGLDATLAYDCKRLFKDEYLQEVVPKVERTFKANNPRISYAKATAMGMKI